MPLPLILLRYWVISGNTVISCSVYIDGDLKNMGVNLCIFLPILPLISCKEIGWNSIHHLMPGGGRVYLPSKLLKTSVIIISPIYVCRCSLFLTCPMAFLDIPKCIPCFEELKPPLINDLTVSLWLSSVLTEWSPYYSWDHNISELNWILDIRFVSCGQFPCFFPRVWFTIIWIQSNNLTLLANAFIV